MLHLFPIIFIPIWLHNKRPMPRPLLGLILAAWLHYISCFDWLWLHDLIAIVLIEVRGWLWLTVHRYAKDKLLLFLNGIASYDSTRIVEIRAAQI